MNFRYIWEYDVVFCLRCCYWIIIIELDCNIYVVNYWVKMKLIVVLKLRFVVVFVFEGVGMVANIIFLMGFLFCF